MKKTTNKGSRRSRYAAGLAAGALLTTAVAALGGDARADTPNLPRVTYYPDLRAFSGPLPTKTQFILEVPVGEEVFDQIELTYWRTEDIDDPCEAPELQPAQATAPAPAPGAAQAGQPAPPGAAQPAPATNPPQSQQAGKDEAKKEPRRIGVRQSLGKDAKRFEVPIQPLTHSAKYCFKVGLSRALSDTDRSRLEQLVLTLIEKASGAIASKKGLSVDDIGKLTAEVFKDYAPYRTARGEKLIEQIDAWIKRENTWALFMRTADAWNDHRAAFDTVNGYCAPVKTVIPALEPVTPVPTASRKAVEEISAAAEEVRTLSRGLAIDPCPVQQEPGTPPTAPKNAGEVGKQLGAFTSAGTTLWAKICADGAADAKLFRNAGKAGPVCGALKEHHDRASVLQSSLPQMTNKASETGEDIKALTASFEQAIGRLRLDVLPSETRTPVPSYAERAGVYISGDAGFMIPWFYGSGDIGFSPLLGANFYFGPVDKDEPLKGWDLCRRVAVTGGIVFNVKDPAGTTSGLVGDTSVFAGVGARATDYLRIGIGATLVNQKDPDPLVNTQRIRALPYVSASVDVDVAGTIKDIFSKDRPSL